MKAEKRKRHRANKIYREIRLVSLRNLFLPVISVIVALGIYILMPFNDVFSPTKVSSSSDAIALYEQGHKYARISIEKLYYTGYDIMSDGKVRASYYYEITNKGCVFYILNGNAVKDRPAELENVSVIVRLSEPDGLLENMITSFASAIGWTTEGITEASGEIVMDQTSYYLERYVAAFVLILADIIYSMALVTINIIFILIPQIHFALLRYYATRPFGIRKALRELENDFLRGQCLRAGNMYVTKKYFYNLGKKEVHIVPIDKIIMGYEHSRLISIFGIHLKMKHTLYLRLAQGEKIVCSEKQTTDVEAVVGYLKENYSDIIWGHTKENKAWAKAKIKEYKSENHNRKHKKNIR